EGGGLRRAFVSVLVLRLCQAIVQIHAVATTSCSVRVCPAPSVPTDLAASDGGPGGGVPNA
ncbi:hypothetical protein PHYSODRAFT_289258, partial [Phytophthora sojae]